MKRAQIKTYVYVNFRRVAEIKSNLKTLGYSETEIEDFDRLAEAYNKTGVFETMNAWEHLYSLVLMSKIKSQHLSNIV
jgi:hypothetical protein